MTEQTKYLQNKIQQWEKLLKNGYLTRKNAWTALWVTLWIIIKYVLPATTPSESEALKMSVSLYMETIS